MQDQIKAADLALELLADKPKHLSEPAFEAILEALLGFSATHSDLAVEACNGVHDEDLPRHESDVYEVGELIISLCKDLGWKPNLGGDPRGYTVKVILPSGRYNTWGGPEEGWGI